MKPMKTFQGYEIVDEEARGRLTAVEERLDSVDGGGSGPEVDLSGLENAVTELDSRVSTTENDISKLKTDVSTNKTAVNGLKNRVTTTEDDITSLETVVENLAEQVAENEIDISSITNRITKNETDISGLETRVSTVEDVTDTFNDRVVAAEGEIDTLQANVTTNSNDINKLKNRVTSTESDINKIDVRVTTNEGSISALDTRVGSAENDISGLDARVAVLEQADDGSIADIEEFKALEVRVGVNETDISELQTVVTGIETNAADIDILDGKITSTSATITSIQGKINAVEGRVTANENGIIDLETRVGANETDISGLESRVGVNETDISGLETRINTAETSLSELETRVDTAETDISNLKTDISSKVDKATTINGKALSSNIELTASNVGADPVGSATNALTEAKSYADQTYTQATGYTDTAIAGLINGAPTTLDTLGEIADAMVDNKSVVESLDAAIGSKADQAEVDGHTGNSTIHITATERMNWNDANSKKHEHGNKGVLDGIEASDVSGWESAVTHISDEIKHITADERTKWNTVDDKVDSSELEDLTIRVIDNETYINESKIRNVNTFDFGTAWILYTDNIKGTYTDIETAAVAFSKFDLMAVSGEMSEDSNKIIQRAKQLNPKLKYFQYTSVKSTHNSTSTGEYAYLNPDGTWEGSVAEQLGSGRIWSKAGLEEQLDHFAAVGADGVLYDEFGGDPVIDYLCYQMGYDPSTFETIQEARNQKYKDVIAIAHERGLNVCINAGYFCLDDGDWYSNLVEDDVWMFESAYLSGLGVGWATWSGAHRNVYNYYTNYYSTGLCKAKSWAMNWISGTDVDVIEGEYWEKTVTYCLVQGLCTGANYVSVDGFGRMYETPMWMIEPFKRGYQRNISQINERSYSIESGPFKLESIQSLLITGNVTEDTLDKIYYTFNGQKFTNAFRNAPQLESKLQDQMNELTELVTGMTDDSKQNANSYWRLAIDDWESDLTYENYTNLLLNSENVVIDKSWATSAELVENSTGGIDLVITYDNQILNYGNNVLLRPFSSGLAEEVGLLGKKIEFGFSGVEFNLDTNGYCPEQGTVYQYDGDGWHDEWPNPGFSIYFETENGNVYNPPKNVESNIGVATGYAYQTTVLDTSVIGLYCWIRAQTDVYLDGTITIKNIYFVDLNEYADEVTKKWYTNIFTCPSTWSMETVVETSEYEGQRVYDVIATAKDAHGSTIYSFTSDEVLKMRGRTYEFGCTELSFSNGVTGEGSSSTDWFSWFFGIRMGDTTYPIYTDTNNKSNVWDLADIPCVSFTVPDTATEFAIVIQTNGYPAETVMTAINVYLYDLDEEVAIRGKTVTNASLRICRVTEEAESKSEAKLNNTLYISDKGRMWMKDLAGERTEIAGGIYSGAVDAGYVGTPEEFGSSLVDAKKDISVINSKITAITDIMAILHSDIPNEAEGDFINVQDASDNGLYSVKAYGMSSQNGTPTLDNSVEIIGLGTPSRNMINPDTCTEADTYFTTAKIAVKPSTTYVSNYPLGGIKGYAYEVDELGLVSPSIVTWSPSIGEEVYAYTTGNNVTELEITYTKQYVSNISLVQLEEGSVSTPFIPYGKFSLTENITNEDETQSQSATIILSSQLHAFPVIKGRQDNVIINEQGYVADVLEVFSDGTGKIIKRLWEFKPNEHSYTDINYKSFTVGYTYDISTMPALNGVADINCGGMSTHIRDYYFQDDDNTTHWYAQGNILKIFIPNSMSIEDIPDAKFIYELATPIEISLTTEEVSSILSLHTYKPVSNIYNSEGGYQEIGYGSDMKTYIDNKFASLTSLLTTGE